MLIYTCIDIKDNSPFDISIPKINESVIKTVELFLISCQQKSKIQWRERWHENSFLSEKLGLVGIPLQSVAGHFCVLILNYKRISGGEFLTKRYFFR